jgi:hypothetical protein
MSTQYPSYNMRNEKEVTGMFINWVLARYSESDT